MRYNRIIAPLILITMLNGCQSRLLRVDTNKPLDIYQICSKLRRDMIFYNNDPNHNFQWRSPTDAASFLKDYQRYHCDEVLAHKNNIPPVKDTPLTFAQPRINGGRHIDVPTPPSRASGDVKRSQRVVRPRRRPIVNDMSDNDDQGIGDRYK